MSVVLKIEDLVVDLGGSRIVDGLTIEIEAGEVFALLGPSGCGKTTTLRAIAGLERPTGGRITHAGQILDGPGVHVPAERRGLGLVFQEGAVFPHLDVAGNIAFGLRHLSRAERRQRVEEVVKLVRLDGLAGRAPHELSGGQRQRVALARALARRPALVLLDEPFSSLDAALRSALRREVFEILRRTETAALLVTHDQDEAVESADRMAVMKAGRLLQTGLPAALAGRPEDPWTAEFLGSSLLRGEVSGGLLRVCGVVLPCVEPPEDGPALAVLKPNQLALSAPADGLLRGILTGTVVRGGLRCAVVRVDEAGSVEVLPSPGQSVEPGRAVGLRPRTDAVWALPA